MTYARSTPATMSKQRSTLLRKTATVSNEFCVEILSFRQKSNVASTMLLRHCCLFWQQGRTKFRFFRQCRNKLNMFNLFRLCQKGRNFTVESFDTVVVCGNKVECCFDKVERCFDNVASTLLLVWTGLYSRLRADCLYTGISSGPNAR